LYGVEKPTRSGELVVTADDIVAKPQDLQATPARTKLHLDACRIAVKAAAFWPGSSTVVVMRRAAKSFGALKFVGERRTHLRAGLRSRLQRSA
jgi:hypothetical protein